MQLSTETDTFIAAQIAPHLRPGEEPLCAAYLLTESSGTLVSALTMKAYFGVLTRERLLLVETRVGAFRPLLENLGLTAHERGDIRGAYVQRGRVTLRLEGDRDVAFRCASSSKHVSSQGAFRELLAREHGGPVAEALARKNRLTSIAGVALSVVILGGVLYASQRDSAKVQVGCQGEEAGMRCTVEHVSGGAKAEACWDVVLTCDNAKTARHHACLAVTPKQKDSILVKDEEFAGLSECDRVSGVEIAGLTIK